MIVIYEALNLSFPYDYEMKTIKHIDNAVLLAEARDLIAGGGKDWDMVKGEAWDEQIIVWPPRTNEFKFLNTYNFLMGQLAGTGLVSSK